MRKKLFILLCFLGLFNMVRAQHSDGMSVNLLRFYKNKLHFGFSIGVNSTDFRVHTIANSAFLDTVINGTKYGIKTIYTKPDPGFALGIIADLRLQEYIRLRFTPNISFASRRIEYTLMNDARDSTRILTKSVESTFLIFPLEIKIQSKRLGNFGAYVIGGGGYMLDLAASKKAPPTSSSANQLEEAIRLKRNDYYYSAGAGADFYLHYFKLGLEAKLVIGVQNLLQPQNNIFSRSLDRVNTHMFVFAITFEG